MISLVYFDGTVSVETGSDLVAGEGTAWLLHNVLGGTLKVEAAGGNTLDVVEVVSDTELRTATAWVGPSGDFNYSINRAGSRAADAVWIYDKLASFHQKPWGIGVQPDGRGTLAERDALNPMPTDNYCWLRVEVDEPAALYFKTPSWWLGPYGFSGEAGPPGPALVPAGAWAEETTYARGRYVAYEGRTFASRVDANQSNEPPDADEDSAEWMFVPAVQGAKGNTGDGWAAVLATVTDGERRVQGVVDWFGGTGTKPPTGMYVGEEGYVEDIEDAVDIRGPGGSIEGVTSFWQERLEDDATAEDSRAGLGLGDFALINLPSVPTGKILSDDGTWIAPPTNDDLEFTVAQLILGQADAANVAQFLGPSGNRFADSFDVLTYVDVAGATNLDASTAGVLRPSLTSSSVFSATLNASTGSSGWTYRMVVPASAISDVSGEVLTLTLRGGGTGVVNAYFGEAASSGEAYAFAAAPYELKVSGSGSISTALDTNIVCDPIVLSAPFDADKNYVLAVYVVSGTTPMKHNASATGRTRYYKNTSDASTVLATGYSSGASEFSFLSVINVSSRNNLSVQSTAFTAPAAPAKMKALANVKEVDTSTAGSDYFMDVSRDGGTTWEEVTLTERYSLPSGLRVVEGQETDVSSQPTGSSPRYRLRTSNNKNVEFHDVYLYWR